ncbi:MAG: AraC family transcriptional regulator [Bacteroidia bacterium]|nr:AraC family transcriptional regulator [Bacteroidia bacterium]
MKDIWFVIFSIGLSQGIFLICALLLLKGKRKLSVYLLLVFLLCVISLVFSEWLKTQFPIDEVLFTFRNGETIPLLIGPIIWFYVLSVLKADFRLEIRHSLHFLPFFLFFLYFLPFYISTDEYKLAYVQSLNQKSIPLDLALFSWFKGLHTLIYILISILFLRKKLSQKRLRDQWFNSRLMISLLGLQMLGILSIYAIVVAEYISPDIQIESDKIGALVISTSFFIFAFAIILFPKTLLPEAKTSRNKYEHSTLNQDEKERILRKLQKKLRDEKQYLNPNLSLAELAHKLEINSNQLSQVINELLGKNFYQLINEYRVEEVKRNILSQEKTLLGIALESGFNSKSAFNRIFKEITGSTPSAYKKSLTNRS